MHDDARFTGHGSRSDIAPGGVTGPVRVLLRGRHRSHGRIVLPAPLINRHGGFALRQARATVPRHCGWTPLPHGRAGAR